MRALASTCPDVSRDRPPAELGLWRLSQFVVQGLQSAMKLPLLPSIYGLGNVQRRSAGPRSKHPCRLQCVMAQHGNSLTHDFKLDPSLCMCGSSCLDCSQITRTGPQSLRSLYTGYTLCDVIQYHMIDSKLSPVTEHGTHAKSPGASTWDQDQSLQRPARPTWSGFSLAGYRADFMCRISPHTGTPM